MEPEPLGQAKDGTWKWRAKVWDTRTDRAVSRSFRTATNSVKAARKERDRIVVELRDQLEQRPTEGSVAHYATEWERAGRHDKSPSTLQGQQRHIDRFVNEFGGTQISELSGGVLLGWYQRLQAGGMSAAGVRVLHRIVRAIAYYARDRHDVALRPSLGKVKLPKAAETGIVAPTNAAVAAILAGVSDEWGRAVRLLALTGVRRGEVVALQWADIEGNTLKVQRAVVDLKGGGVHVRGTTKGKRSRTLMLHPAAVAVLDEQRAHVAAYGGGSPWVFPSWTVDPTGGTPKRAGWVSTMWNRNRVALGAAGVRLHDLRHWLVTFMLEQGVPISDVQAFAGHSKASTTLDVYSHRTAGGADRAMRALDALPAAKPAG